MPPSRPTVRKADNGTRREARTSGAVAEGSIEVSVTFAPETFTVRLQPSSEGTASLAVCSRRWTEWGRSEPDIINGAVNWSNSATWRALAYIMGLSGARTHGW